MGIGFFLCYNGFINYPTHKGWGVFTYNYKVYILPSQECTLPDVLDFLVGPKTMANSFEKELTTIASGAIIDTQQQRKLQKKDFFAGNASVV